MKTGYTRFLNIQFWMQIFHNFLKACHRFPLSIMCMLTISFLTVLENHDFNLLSHLNYQRTILIAMISGFWFTSTELFSESHNYSKLQQFQLATPVFALICWLVLSNISFAPSLTLLLAMVMAVTFSAYLFRKFDNASIWYFNYQLTAGLCFGLLSTFILCIGLSLVLKSVDYLFEIDINSRLFSDIWIVGISFFTPAYFLANVPTQFDYERSHCDFPRGVYFIQNYILTPLSLVYMVVLYAYLLKIVIQWELPRGNLGKMISIFGVIGIYTHLTIYPVFDRNSGLLNWFYRNFYKMMVVPLALLILAIVTRILQYGLTESRYLVIICIIWFSLLIFSYLLKGIKFQLRNVTLILASLAIISSLGPWRINNLPIQSQFSRLQNIFIKNGLLVNKQYIAPTIQPDAETRKSISSIIKYIVCHGAGKKILPWFNKDDQAILKPLVDCAEEKCRYFNSADVMKHIGIDYVYWRNDKHFNIHLQKNHKNYLFGDFNTLIPVINYDYIIPIHLTSINCKKEGCAEKIAQPWQSRKIKNLKAHLKENNYLEISSDDYGEIVFNLNSVLENIKGRGDIELQANEVHKLVLEQSSKGIAVKLLIHQINGEIINDKKQMTMINVVLLLAVNSP